MKIKAQIQTRKDNFLTDTVTYPVMNAYKVLISDVETVILFRVLTTAQHCTRMMTKRENIQYHFSEA